MKVHTKQVFQYHDSGEFELLEDHSYTYDGPVSECFGGSSKTKSSTTNVVETNQAGIDSVDGVGVAALGDVSLNLQTTDLGAVQGAFDFTQDFADSAFNFANDAQSQAADISERALETSQAAVASVATGGGSDLAKINSKTIVFVVAGLAAVFVLPLLFRRK